MPGCFIAKSEVAGWPLLGRLARLQNTLFFERNAKHARNQIAVMNHHLNTAGNLILFPEGTSTAGITVAPFKSSLLHAAQTAANVAIQPVTIAYTHYQGARMNQASRDYFAWYSDMPFLSHFMRMTGMSRGSVQVIFHPPVQLQQFSSRKSCAEYCRRQVGDALKQALNNAPATPEKPIPRVDKGLSSS